MGFVMSMCFGWQFIGGLAVCLPIISGYARLFHQAFSSDSTYAAGNYNGSLRSDPYCPGWAFGTGDDGGSNGFY